MNIYFFIYERFNGSKRVFSFLCTALYGSVSANLGLERLDLGFGRSDFESGMPDLGVGIPILGCGRQN